MPYLPNCKNKNRKSENFLTYILYTSKFLYRRIVFVFFFFYMAISNRDAAAFRNFSFGYNLCMYMLDVGARIKRFHDYHHFEDQFLMYIYKFRLLRFIFLQEWELLVISKLEWKIVAVTSFDFVDHIMEQIKWKRRNDSMLRRHMLTLISFCYIGKYYFTQPIWLYMRDDFTQTIPLNIYVEFCKMPKITH